MELTLTLMFVFLKKWCSIYINLKMEGRILKCKKKPIKILQLHSH